MQKAVLVPRLSYWHEMLLVWTHCEYHDDQDDHGDHDDHGDGDHDDDSGDGDHDDDGYDDDHGSWITCMSMNHLPGTCILYGATSTGDHSV